MKTHIVSILDRSGSMASRANDVIGGYNAFLQEQQSLGLVGDTWSLTLFSDLVTPRIDRQPLDRVPTLTPETYRVRGSTALYDAIGETMSPWKELPPNERGVLVIATDGEENVSQNWTLSRVKALLEELERSGAWTIVYLGVSVDGFGAEAHLRQSANTGIAVTNALSNPVASQLYGQTSSRVAALRSSRIRATTDLYAGEIPPAETDDDDLFGSPSKS